MTAANSSSISDGAAALIMMRESEAEKRGATPLARVVAHSTHAAAPKDFPTAPIGALKKLFEKTGWSPDFVDLFEINEAFAVVAMAAMRDLGLAAREGQRERRRLRARPSDRRLGRAHSGDADRRASGAWRQARRRVALHRRRRGDRYGDRDGVNATLAPHLVVRALREPVTVECFMTADSSWGTLMQTQKLAALAAILGGAVALAAPAAAQETLTLQTVHSTGTNTSLGTAQMLDLSDATNGPLFGAALTAFNAKNSDTVHQNATSFTAAGQFVSPQFYPFGSRTVPVNANVAAVGHLTAPGTAGATNYFGFAETAGGQIGLFGEATQPPNQGTELLLYDNNENLVAIASGNTPGGLSSRIDFTVPIGEDGTWQAAITQGLSTTSPINYLLQLQMPYSALSTFTTNVIGSGQEKNGSLGTYDVNANVGDNLHFDVNATTPSTGTELLLYDPNGNLVAIASQNGSDGLSSIIDFTVPDADSGEWQIQVAPDANASPPHALRLRSRHPRLHRIGPSQPLARSRALDLGDGLRWLCGTGLHGFPPRRPRTSAPRSLASTPLIKTNPRSRFGA